MSAHPDDPKVVYVAANTCYCPDTPEQRARFERMWKRLQDWRKLEQMTARNKPKTLLPA